MTQRHLTAALLCLFAGLSTASATGQLRDASSPRSATADPGGVRADSRSLIDDVTNAQQRVTFTAHRSPKSRRRPAPTHANVRYGAHERNVFDLWLPKNAATEQIQPWPVYVFFHGGGFVGGDKRSFNPAPFVNAGMAVVSANYRFVDGSDTLSPAPLHDGARVVQYLRHRSEEWNLDADRIAVSGSSAGAVMTLWIGYHDDLADPNSDDVVLRQSSRVRCLIPLDGPTQLDPRWITSNMGGPKHVHQSFPLMFGAGAESIGQADVLERVLESSAMTHVSADDPPTLLIYGGVLDGIPLPESATTGVLIHHPYFGEALQTELRSHGIACEFHHSLVQPAERLPVIHAWLQEHLLTEHLE